MVVDLYDSIVRCVQSYPLAVRLYLTCSGAWPPGHLRFYQDLRKAVLILILRPTIPRMKYQVFIPLALLQVITPASQQQVVPG